MRISDWSSDVCSSDLTGGHIDGLAFGQRHDRLLNIRTLIGLALPALRLALRHQGVDTLDGDVEQRLDRSLDLRLRGSARHLVANGIVLGQHRRLLSAYGCKHYMDRKSTRLNSRY